MPSLTFPSPYVPSPSHFNSKKQKFNHLSIVSPSGTNSLWIMSCHA
jgi:hypothetical protein